MFNPGWHLKQFFVNNTLPGTVARQFRYLGPTITDNLSTTNERNNRLQAIRVGWAKMGHFWTSHYPIKVKRIVFLGMCVAAGCSGMEAFVLKQADWKPLDSLLVKFMRVILIGAAHSQDEEGKHVAISNDEVFRKMKVTPLRIE